MAADKQTQKKKPKNYFQRLGQRIAENRKVFTVYTVLSLLVMAIAVRCFTTGRYESFGVCILSWLLFYVPALAEDMFKIHIPPVFEAIIYIFIFAAEILGEVGNYYEIFPVWDMVLHATNGFLCAAVGFSMVYLLNRNSKNVRLSPLYMVLVAFSFSMTIGVLWEFFEFIAERILVFHDAQRDTLVKDFVSFYLGNGSAGSKLHVQNIVRTLIETAVGDTIIIEGGYLDIGLVDTMKDLFVNFIGAIVFSIFGYTYLKTSKHERLVNGLMLQPADEPTTEKL